VTDTGPGVPNEIVESGELFAPFRTGSESGLGVGLYQCRTVLEELGGRIELVPGDDGAVFEMCIPAERV
jgi:two-component system C4-dicarboxylate transport sensor histidine kinase DctB